MKKNNLKNIQTEVDTAYLYRLLAQNEEDENVREIFEQMKEIETAHALAFLKKAGLSETDMPRPSTRAKMTKWIGKIFGYDYVLGILLDTEKSLSYSIGQLRKTKGGSSISDTAHVRILKNILENNDKIPTHQLSRFEKRHKNVGGNALRAAVLGGNDGLISNFSLIMGVAGASSGQQEVLLAGIAGLLAGALSMALGEWISVKSSQELYENQMNLEMEELETNPEGEEQELALIYRTKGIPKDQAAAIAKELMKDKVQAHKVLVKEELGIEAEELKGSAFEAALTSFILFAIGAIIPLTPFFFTGGNQAILCSAGFSALGLFLIGAVITLFTGKSVWFSGTRMVLFGLTAAAITFGIGKLIGVSVIG
ncbi:VIT1/CCC1 transporter family protein [Bergeyella sp. RCAD1439]|uniref:VIT1/CCC1 transporter family protein n=1 Tax=Bergeyella anatis TaxID=3113737 RepID=UPI002E190355|nr:VIT1/CCC1 transporter family protein [Bergeyella sp. RCAD1439]